MPKKKHYKRRILLAVFNEDPSPLLWHLLSAFEDRQELPTEVHTLSSASGCNSVVDLIHQREDGVFFDFCRLNHLGIQFPLANIHPFSRAETTPSDTLASTPKGVVAGESLMTWIRDFTQDADASLTVLLPPQSSLIAYAHTAMTLFGRKQDRLVLTTGTVPDTLWTTRSCACLDILLNLVRKQHLTHGAESKNLASVLILPFQSKRLRLPKATLRSKHRITMQWVALQLDTGIPDRLKLPTAVRSELLFIVENRTFLCLGEVLMTLPPIEYAAYLWLADRRNTGKPPVRRADPTLADEFLPFYRMVLHHGKEPREGKEFTHYEELENRIKDNPDYFITFFTKRKALINEKIRRVLGNRASPFEIVQVGVRPFGFEIDLPGSKILIP